jgi:hypothetical protein
VEKYERTLIFRHLKLKFFIEKKHHFWNFSSQASTKIFPGKSEYAISLNTKKPAKQ